MGYKEMYQSWLDNPYFDEDTRNANESSQKLCALVERVVREL